MSFSGPPTTFHLVPRAEWEASPPGQPYTPRAYAADGFVHCTDGAAEVAATANRYFADLSDDLLVLELDRAQLTAPVRYDDPRRIYPHVYGPIDRVAIRRVSTLRRGGSGLFEAPAE